MRARSLSVLIFVTAACGYSIKTSTDYDRRVNFADIKTFDVVKGNSSGNPLLDQRIEGDVVAALKSKGWTEVAAGTGRAAVVVHAATKTKHSYETFYDGWDGGWRWRWDGGFGSSTTYV